MQCEEARELILIKVTDTFYKIPKEKWQDLEDHISLCSNCRSYSKDILGIHALIKWKCGELETEEPEPEPEPDSASYFSNSFLDQLGDITRTFKNMWFESAAIKTISKTPTAIPAHSDLLKYRFFDEKTGEVSNTLDFFGQTYTPDNCHFSSPIIKQYVCSAIGVSFSTPFFNGMFAQSLKENNDYPHPVEVYANILDKLSLLDFHSRQQITYYFFIPELLNIIYFGLESLRLLLKMKKSIDQRLFDPSIDFANTNKLLMEISDESNPISVSLWKYGCFSKEVRNLLESYLLNQNSFEKKSSLSVEEPKDLLTIEKLRYLVAHSFNKICEDESFHCDNFLQWKKSYSGPLRDPVSLKRKWLEQSYSDGIARDCGGIYLFRIPKVKIILFKKKPFLLQDKLNIILFPEHGSTPKTGFCTDSYDTYQINGEEPKYQQFYNIFTQLENDKNNIIDNQSTISLLLTDLCREISGEVTFPMSVFNLIKS